MTTEHQQLLELCKCVLHDTARLYQVSDCEPYYARVLQYLEAHPDARDFATTCFAHAVYGPETPAAGNIYLIQYLRKHFKWPEVLEAARRAWNDGGNGFYAHEVKMLIDIYEK